MSILFRVVVDRAPSAMPFATLESGRGGALPPPYEEAEEGPPSYADWLKGREVILSPLAVDQNVNPPTSPMADNFSTVISL